MSRYIDADLIEYEPMCRARGNGMYEDCEIAHKDQIDDIPTADVRENVRGEWLYKKTTDDYHVTGQCSNCHERRRIDNFCPNCGADMRKENE